MVDTIGGCGGAEGNAYYRLWHGVVPIGEWDGWGKGGWMFLALLLNKTTDTATEKRDRVYKCVCVGEGIDERVRVCVYEWGSGSNGFAAYGNEKPNQIGVGAIRWRSPHSLKHPIRTPRPGVPCIIMPFNNVFFNTNNGYSFRVQNSCSGGLQPDSFRLKAFHFRRKKKKKNVSRGNFN